MTRLINQLLACKISRPGIAALALAIAAPAQNVSQAQSTTAAPAGAGAQDFPPVPPVPAQPGSTSRSLDIDEFIHPTLVVPASSASQAASMALGKGFDSITGAVGRTCVGVPNSPDLPKMSLDELGQISGAQGELNIFSSDQADSEFRADSTTLAARFDSGVMRGDGNYASYNARRISAFSSTLHVIADAYTGRRILDTRNLQPIGQYGSGPFRKQCGDHVVVGEILGARLHAKYEVFYRSVEERNATEGALSAAYNSGLQSASANAAFKRSIEQASTSKRMTYKIVQQDGKAGSFIKPENLLEEAYRWRDHTPAQSQVVAWIVVPYSTLFDAPSGPPLPDSVSVFFDEQYRNLRRLAGLQASLLVVSDKPGMLGREDPGDVRNLIAKVEQDIAAVKRAVARCGDGSKPDNCVDPKLSPVKDMELALPISGKLRIQQMFDPADDPYVNQVRVVELSGYAYADCGDLYTARFDPGIVSFVVDKDGKRTSQNADQPLVLRPGEKLLGFDISAPAIRPVPGRVRCDGDKGISFSYFTPLFPKYYSESRSTYAAIPSQGEGSR